MKNHEKVNGKLLQTNKKWSHLSQKQRACIYDATRQAHADYVEEHERLPVRKQKELVLDKVHAKMLERDIWIPYGEFRPQVMKTIDRLNRKHPLFVPSAPKPSKKKKLPEVPFADFPGSDRNAVREILANEIQGYILQTHNFPTNNIRDSHIKQAIRSFNMKNANDRQQRMGFSDDLNSLYDEMREAKFAELKDSGIIPRELAKPERDRLCSQQVILETERLIIRKINHRTDYQDIKAMLSDPEVMYAWERVFTTKKEIMEWINRQYTRYDRELASYFAAVDRASGELIGQLGLMWSNIQGQRCLEVGYILKHEHWHKGYAAEGTAALIDYGFRLFGVNKIYAAIRPENPASIAVAERLGMKRDGEIIKKYQGKKMKHFVYTIERID